LSLPCPAHRPDPPPFPTRRSSDLAPRARRAVLVESARRRPGGLVRLALLGLSRVGGLARVRDRGRLRGGHALLPADRQAPRRARSEEHTSELQSRGHLVCRLLLEK